MARIDAVLGKGRDAGVNAICRPIGRRKKISMSSSWHMSDKLSGADGVGRREATLLLDAGVLCDIIARKRTKRGGQEIAFVFRYRRTGISECAKSRARTGNRAADRAVVVDVVATPTNTASKQSSYSYVCIEIRQKGRPVSADDNLTRITLFRNDRIGDIQKGNWTRLEKTMRKKTGKGSGDCRGEVMKWRKTEQARVTVSATPGDNKRHFIRRSCGNMAQVVALYPQAANNTDESGGEAYSM
uniref:Uncharacterized protein n=1 Tax=Plectus sambesii TaxID=2011161 RepID=A0A914WS44_9BILA